MTQIPCPLFEPLELPCGLVLTNRIVKSAMSDSLGDGRGNPTVEQMRLYERWALGGVAASIIGEVQFSARHAEKPGNLVLHDGSDSELFKALADRGSSKGTQLWLQISHAGAMAYPPISTPSGPSAIDIPGLSCTALSTNEVRALPGAFAKTALLAQKHGFGGVQIHAAHGFLLSQFLSPLFNQRSDAYGGAIEQRMRILLDVVTAVRDAVEPGFVVALKLNSSDQLAGGLEQDEALAVISALDSMGVDLIDISGGTYFPGATSASDSAGKGPYFVDFAARARQCTSTPLMLTGGFKTRHQAVEALQTGHVDALGVARALVLNPELAQSWQSDKAESQDPDFPVFDSPPEGGITAWYTMQLTGIAQDREDTAIPDLLASLAEYNARDAERTTSWNAHFGRPGAG